MPRFFVDSQSIEGEYITIKGDDAHHISFSLRMAAGEEITVCDGKGNEYACELFRLDGETVSAKIKEKRKGEGESPVEIHLYQAFPKGDKLELIIQKAVELGVKSITPFESERCVKRPKADKIDKQLLRMNKIAFEAAKQCGRACLPEVKAPLSFSEMLKKASECELAVFCYEDCRTQSLRELLTKKGEGVRSLAVVIGSEGGFSLSEANSAEEAGMIPVSLGKRILRCETAPIFALSSIAFFYEL